MYLLVMLAAAFVGAAIVSRAVGQCKRAADGMLGEYARLLSEARSEKDEQPEDDRQRCAPPGG